MSWAPMAIGAGLGAFSSMFGGSKKAGDITTTQDIPAWLKPYVTSNLNMAQGVRDETAGQGGPLLDASQNELMKILSGAYLTPGSNPYLKQYGDQIADTIGSRVDSRFNLAGRTGSFAHGDELSKSIGNAILPLYSGAYDAERGRQYGSAIGAPGVVGGGVQAEFQPFASFSSLIPGLRTESQPYYENKLGGILSGASAGAGLGRMFGDSARPDPLENAGMGDLPLWRVA
jgi:hypothetical protein